MRIRLAVFVFCLFVAQFAIGQAAPSAITNSDVISMTKAGIGEQTIILAIQRGPAKFDTSPQALISLKQAGVSDQVLNAVLMSASGKSQANPESRDVGAEALFQKALDAIGSHEKVMAVRALRFKADVSVSGQGKALSFEREQVTVFPGKDYETSQAATGPLQKRVITPDFSYMVSGNVTSAVSPDDLETAREQSEFGTMQIAQHAADYAVSSAGSEQIGDVTAEKLRISKEGKCIIWDVDPQTGRIVSSSQDTTKGNIATEFSDYRLVQGVSLPFKRITTEFGYTVTSAIGEYEINPVIDEAIFQRPTESVNQGLTLKILQEQSMPYVQESGGGISTSCNIVGTANTSAYATAYGNSAYGNATTNSNQHMSCNSYDTTMRWPHVLNVMFAQASDGNSYIIACDRAWRWSKCVPLRAGDVFSARFTGKGIEVQAVNPKGKEENPTYQILQSKASR
jgi:hypothetical protein